MTGPFIPARPRGRHPTPEKLFAAHRRPEAPESEAVLAHAAVCARCSEELLQLEAFTAPEPVSAAHLEAAWQRFGEPPVRRSKAAFSRPVLALAAGLAAGLLGLGIWVAQNRTPSASSPPPPVDVVRGGSEVQGDWLPNGPLSEAPTEIVFPAGAEPQRVLVFEIASGYRWTSEPTTEGRVIFPEEERKKIEPGVEYFWTLTGQETAARSFVVTGKS